MVALITNTRTKENKVITLFQCYPGWQPCPMSLEQAADQFIKRIACTYPYAWMIVHNVEKSIDIMAGNGVAKCIFEIRLVEELKDSVEELKDSDDSFFY